MKKILGNRLIFTKEDTYLGLVIIIAPLLNFLSGINVDLYTPSLPAIAHYYSASIMAVKNTITAAMIGFAVGSIIFGTSIDIFGRRCIILLGLMLYIIASFLALACVHIEQLMLVRFIQGMMVATVSIGGRAIIIDNFIGHQRNVGLLYTSVAYGLGPIIAPFIGGILQNCFGWEANFLAYALFAVCLFVIFSLYIDESLPSRQKFLLRTIISNYSTVIWHGTFMAGIVIMSLCQFELMIYPTVGAFLVENVLHHTPSVYGDTALLIGCGYLLGTLTNRLLIKRWDLNYLTSFGFVLMVVGLILQISFAFMKKLDLFTITLPIMIMGFSNGFIFINIMGRCIRLFPDNVGIAIGVLICFLMSIAAAGVFIISHINIDSLKSLAAIFAIAIAIQILIFYTIFTHGMKAVECS